jgi:hypothetical protein
MANPVVARLTEDEVHQLRSLLSRHERGGDAKAEREPSSGDPSDARFKADAGREILRRKARSDYFPPNIFGEPAWEIMLLLYSSDERFLRVTAITDRSGVPLATVNRVGLSLEGKGLIETGADKHDRRVRNMWLTDESACGLAKPYSDDLMRVFNWDRRAKA